MRENRTLVASMASKGPTSKNSPRRSTTECSGSQSKERVLDCLFVTLYTSKFSHLSEPQHLVLFPSTCTHQARLKSTTPTRTRPTFSRWQCQCCKACLLNAAGFVNRDAVLAKQARCFWLYAQAANATPMSAGAARATPRSSHQEHGPKTHKGHRYLNLRCLHLRQSPVIVLSYQKNLSFQVVEVLGVERKQGTACKNQIILTPTTCVIHFSDHTHIVQNNERANSQVWRTNFPCSGSTRM